MNKSETKSYVCAQGKGTIFWKHFVQTTLKCVIFTIILIMLTMTWICSQIFTSLHPSDIVPLTKITFNRMRSSSIKPRSCLSNRDPLFSNRDRLFSNGDCAYCDHASNYVAVRHVRATKPWQTVVQTVYGGTVYISKYRYTEIKKSITM